MIRSSDTMHIEVRNTIFLALAVFGYVALWRFASQNGTFAVMGEWSSQNRLPGTRETYATEFTRWRWLDEFIRSLLTLFWPMVNGTQPGSSLMCFYFAGQGITAWILTAIEGQRRLNKGDRKLISFTTAYGLLFQGLGIGIIGPLFHLCAPLGNKWTSPVFVRHRTDVDAIIPATIGGIIIPTILMSLHAPTVISLEQKIDLIRLWQFFPLLFCLGQRIWTGLISVWLSPCRDELVEKNPQVQRRALRRVYLFGLCCAVVPHVSTTAVSLMSISFPSFFAGNISSEFHPWNLFVPVSPFSGAEARTVGEGAHWFLQWDMILMFCTYLVWAYFADVKVKYPDSGLVSLSLILRLLSWSLLFGPMGAALLAIWERDDVVFEAEEPKIMSRKGMAAKLASFSKTEHKKD